MTDDVTIDYQNCKRGLAYAMNEAMNERNRAILDGDMTARAEAAFKLADLNAKDRNLDQLYQDARRPQQPAPMAGADDLSRRDQELCRKYGLAPGNLPIAKNWTTSPGLTDEQKIETWLGNRQRLANDRATGAYRDDQGRVTR